MTREEQMLELSNNLRGELHRVMVNLVDEFGVRTAASVMIVACADAMGKSLGCVRDDDKRADIRASAINACDQTAAKVLAAFNDVEKIQTLLNTPPGGTA